MKTIKVKLIDNSTYYINTDNIDYIVGSAYSIMDIHIPEGKEINGIGMIRVFFDNTQRNEYKETDAMIVSTDDIEEYPVDEHTKTGDSLSLYDDEFKTGEKIIEDIIKKSYVDLSEYSSQILEINTYYRVSGYVTEKVYNLIKNEVLPNQEESLWKHGDTKFNEANGSVLGGLWNDYQE